MPDQDPAPEAPAVSPVSDPPPADRQQADRSQSQAKAAAAKDADRETRRQAHFERALAAAGKPAPDADPEEADPEESAETAEAKEDEPDPPEQKGKHRNALDKAKSHKHLDKVRKGLDADVAAHEKSVRDFERQQAREKQINDAVTETYAPMVTAQNEYKAKDYRHTKAFLEKHFEDKLENIVRNIYGSTKDGMATADLRYELEQVKADRKSTRLNSSHLG